MTDVRLKLELPEDLSSRLIAAAEGAGRPVVDYAADIIDGALDDDWSETARRWADFKNTEDSVSVEEAMSRLREGLKARFAARH